MFVVAVTRWGPERQAGLAELAEHLGMFPYDLRVRFNAPLPTLVARVSERGEAAALMQLLRAHGHGAVGCDLDTVTPAHAMLSAREFSFEEPGVLRCAGAAAPGEGPRETEVRPGEILALIHAMAVSESQEIRETTTKKFSATRAVLSGGMALRKKTTATTTSTNAEAEGRVYLIRRSYAEPVIFGQHGLRYAGLGADKGHSSFESFAALVTKLRAFAPEAHYDDRLVKARPKSTFEGATRSQVKNTASKTVTRSNVSAVDLAAYLLVVGLARGQL